MTAPVIGSVPAVVTLEFVPPVVPVPDDVFEVTVPETVPVAAPVGGGTCDAGGVLDSRTGESIGSDGTGGMAVECEDEGVVPDGPLMLPSTAESGGEMGYMSSEV